MQYEKVDNNTLKVTETSTKETSLTIAQIDHEIAGINADIKTLNDRHAVTIAEFTARKEKYEAMRAEALKLGISEKPVEKIVDAPMEM